MNDRTQKLLSRQLSSQARLLEQQQGSQAVVSAAAACDALLKAIMDDACAMQDPEAFQVLYARLCGIARQAETFFDRARDRAQSAAEPLAASLADQRQLADRMREKLEQTRTELEKLQVKNEADTARVEENKRRLGEARDIEKGLTTLMRTYSDQAIKQLEQDNAALQARYKAASARHGALSEANRKLTEDLKKTTEAMKRLPQKNHDLVQQGEAAEQRLQRLKNARQLYSAEKQAELEREIESITAAAEKDQQAVQLLQARLTDLQGQKTEYDADRQQLSTNVLDLLQSAMADLEKALDDHRQQLEGIRSRADTLAQRMQACQDLRRQYASWLDADVTPLEAMARVLERGDAVELRRTMDPGSLNRVRRLRGEIEERLNQLDDILKKCSDAVRTDSEQLNKLARP